MHIKKYVTPLTIDAEDRTKILSSDGKIVMRTYGNDSEELAPMFVTAINNHANLIKTARWLHSMVSIENLSQPMKDRLDNIITDINEIDGQ